MHVKLALLDLPCFITAMHCGKFKPEVCPVLEYCNITPEIVWPFHTTSFVLQQCKRFFTYYGRMLMYYYEISETGSAF